MQNIDHHLYVRTKNSLRNSTVALVLQIVSMLVGFFARRVFIRYLGVEVMGLNTTITSILNFLNLAELGISMAISVTLYKPLFERDEKAIREIMALQGRMYRIIGSIVLAGGLVVLFFIPGIFNKSTLPLWYPYSTFCVLLYSSLLWYFFNYKKNLLYADQQNHKVLLCTKLVSLVKQTAQILAVLYLDNGYIWWLAIEAAASTVSTVLVWIIVDRNYPFLREGVDINLSLSRKYPGVIQKIKYIAFHKLGSFALSQSSPIFIYAFTSLSTVGFYGNYILLTTNLTAIFSALSAGLSAGIGNMVAEGEKRLIIKVFRELFSSRMLIVGICCICLWFLTEPFICIWLGSGYLLGRTTLALLICQFFISNTRNVVDDYLVAYGLFQDIWSPVAETILNVGLALVLGSRFGLNGVLLAVLVSQLVIVFTWKPIFLMLKGLKEPYSFYVKLYFKCFLPCLLAFGAAFVVSRVMNIDPYSGIWRFIAYSLAIGATSTVVYCSVLYFTEDGIRDFFDRLKTVLTTRGLRQATDTER